MLVTGIHTSACSGARRWAGSGHKARDDNRVGSNRSMTVKSPLVIVLMGVSGSGKSTAGAALSQKLGWPFRDADSFHPPANVEKMSRGTPLTDEDRWPWLAAIAQWVDERCQAGERGIVSCSALKRTYRNRIIGTRSGVRLVYLKGDMALIGRGLQARKHHFM